MATNSSNKVTSANAQMDAYTPGGRSRVKGAFDRNLYYVHVWENGKLIKIKAF